MNIFNSLGSNYSFGFALRALAAGNGGEYRGKLVELLKKKYGGEVYLTYKGREALRLALRMVGLRKGKKGEERKMAVAICGFTCYAVYEACVKEGMDVEYLDIERESLNFSVESLKERCEKNADIGVVIVQNTLGIVCDVKGIADFCKRRGLVLIEDLAHSIGAAYKDGRDAGTVGDFVILSFSQDKVVDGVSGGAMVVREQEAKMDNGEILKGDPIASLQDDKEGSFASLPLGQQIRDRFYPLFTWVIRETYGVHGLGKAIHAILRKFNLLSKPMAGGDGDVFYGLPNWYCELIYLQFMNLKKDLAHRRKIALVYEERLSEDLLLKGYSQRVGRSANLRFPILAHDRESLIKYLKGKGIFVSDIWYDSPIAPKRFLKMTDYKHECPKSEEVSEMIVNLPTHRGVSKEDARRIVGYVIARPRSDNPAKPDGGEAIP